MEGCAEARARVSVEKGARFCWNGQSTRFHHRGLHHRRGSGHPHRSGLGSIDSPEHVLSFGSLGLRFG